MDENRVAGTAKHIGGKPQESYGRVTGDAKTQAEGISTQVTGAAQDLYGKARDGASDLADATSRAARETASSFEKTLRHTIENQPHTAVAIALGLGWLFGRMHRPLYYGRANFELDVSKIASEKVASDKSRVKANLGRKI